MNGQRVMRPGHYRAPRDLGPLSYWNSPRVSGRYKTFFAFWVLCFFLFLLPTLFLWFKKKFNTIQGPFPGPPEASTRPWVRQLPLPITNTSGGGGHYENSKKLKRVSGGREISPNKSELIHNEVILLKTSSIHSDKNHIWQLRTSES